MRFWILFILLLGRSALAADVEGMWKTSSLDKENPQAIIKLFVDHGILYGEVVEILDSKRQGLTCTRCLANKKDQPLVGMVVLWKYKLKDDVWDLGRLLNPADGKIYASRIRMISQDTLEIVGYKGLEFFGETYTWTRVQ